MRDIFKYCFGLSILMMFSSCIFIVRQDKNVVSKDSLSTIDSSKAYALHNSLRKKPDSAILVVDTVKKDSILLPASKINIKNVQPQQLVDFAKTLIGIPYHYASTNPQVGFDCSGFVTYVFSHFNIAVPRSSIDFTHVGTDIPVEQSKPGDLVLFTGTDSTERFVGHMGIIVSNANNEVNFIHSTSGKKHGVTITPLNGYYKGRYVKTIRIFPQNY
ncbi:MAG: C40 family peptidase [Candidatus Dadabacteria bacterium]